MKISLVLRDVTFETLNDPAFVATAKKFFPDLKALHVEFDAARAAVLAGHSPSSAFQSEHIISVMSESFLGDELAEAIVATGT